MTLVSTNHVGHTVRSLQRSLDFYVGLLGFEAAFNRDYPLMFGTLYFFSLVGLLLNLVGDIMYTVVDPRIDFEARAR